MAIILRGEKGTSLTHSELDNNFRSFFYSASVSGTTLSFFTSASLNNEYRLPLTNPSGRDYYIQFKAGNEPSGANALFSGSENYLYDYRQQHLKHTGSFTNIGDATIDGDLVVTGIVTAQEMRTEFNNSSVIFESGSTKFGDTSDDQHSFTGSLELNGSLTSSADITIAEWGSISGSLASNLKYSTDTSASLASDITSNSASLAERIQSGSDSVQDTYLRNTTDTLEGDLIVTGRINATEINTTYVTSSILYNSGSNIFGDAASDIHIFTGSILTEQSISGSDIRINEWGSVSSSLASINTTIEALSTDYNDLENIPNGIVSASSISSSLQGTFELNTNGVNGPVISLGLDTDDNPTFDDLTLTGFSSVSSSLASLVAGTITINNDADNRIITANGNSTLSGESNLTFDGSTLRINSTTIENYSSARTDITGLVNGSDSGTLIEGLDGGHTVVGLRSNNSNDSFAIVSTNGVANYSDETYNTLAFRVESTGDTTIGGDASISGSLTVDSTLMRDYTSGDSDITTLVTGSTFGTIIEGNENGHLVVGLRSNDTTDSFTVISRGSNYSNDNYDRLAFRVDGMGDTTIGGDATIEGDLSISGFTSVSASLAAASVDTQLSDDEVQDIVAGMVTGNTESGISVTVGNSGTKLDFTVASQTDNNFTNALKSKLDGIAENANNYSLPVDIENYTSTRTDITGLVNGTTEGTLIEGFSGGHTVFGLRSNNSNDSFAIVSTDSLANYSSETYDTLAFRVETNGDTTIGGNLQVVGDVTAFHSSDENLKSNIELISKPIDKIKQIKGVSFDWNEKSNNTGHDIGVIAQDIEKVLPEIVATRDNGYKAVRYEKIVALLIEAVKDQQSQIDELKAKL